jgi:hypothetical protein
MPLPTSSLRWQRSNSDEEGAMTTMNAAVVLARLGFAVFPCAPNTKIPAIPKTAGGAGCLDASKDLERVRALFKGRKQANVGIAARDDLIIIDLDVKAGEDGRTTLATWEAEEGPLPRTRRARTPTGGEHIYLRLPPGTPRVKNAARFAVGVDVRSVGGYVVAPPSVVNGKPYEWIDEAPIAEAPSWLVALLPLDRPIESSFAQLTPVLTLSSAPTAWARRALEDELAKVRAAPHGQVNHTLNTAAFSLGQIVAGGNLDNQEVERALLAAAIAAGHGDNVGGAKRTIRSGLDAGAKEPRQPLVRPAAGPGTVSRDQETPKLVVPPFASEAAFAAWEKPLPPAQSTGVQELDDALGGGMRAESIYLLNAPTGRGKTGLAIQMTRFFARARTVAYVGTELSQRQILARFAAQELDRPWLPLYDMGPEAAPLISEALSNLKLRVLGLGSALVPMLDAIAQTDGVAPVLVLDYLQHLARQGNPEDRRIANAQASEALRRWTESARTLALVVSAVGRVFYGSDDRSGRDYEGAAKESGDLDYDSSALLFLETDPCPPGGTAAAKLHVSKSRFGAGGGVIGMRFDGAKGVFSMDPASLITDDHRAVLDAYASGANTENAITKALGKRRQTVSKLIGDLVQKGIMERCPLRVLRDL